MTRSTKAIVASIIFSVPACMSEMADEPGGASQSTQALGVTGPAFYVDGTAYRTVGTPALLPEQAPDHSFDTIYNLNGAQELNVATAAPGDDGYNGGRWQVHLVTFPDYEQAVSLYDQNASGDFDSDEELYAAFSAGAAVDEGIILLFTCPVIPLPRGGKSM